MVGDVRPDHGPDRVPVRAGGAPATARAYLLELLPSVERKLRLAEQAGHVRPGPMQRLLCSARWDADAVRDDVRSYAAERLGTDGGVLVVDETGFLAKGRSSVGLQRQYTCTAGRIDNAQVGVFLTLATGQTRALPQRGRDTQDGQFATKPRLAMEMITAALDAAITAS